MGESCDFSFVDPADYPEAMAVQFPWRNDENMTELPVIRMGPGTMVVVVPSAINNGVVTQVPVQAPTQMSIPNPAMRSF